MIAVGVVVAIIAAVAVYYFFFTESKEAKEAREAKEAKEVKEKDAKEYVLKLIQIRKEKKPYSEFIAVEEAFYKKYPNVPKRIKSDNDLYNRFQNRLSDLQWEGPTGILVSIM